MKELNFDVSVLSAKAPEFLMTYGTKIVLAIAVYILGKWIAKTLVNVMEKTLLARGVDETVAIFTKNICYYALFTMVIIAALGQLGVQTASFVAIIGAAGLAVGFALQGSLANFAAGVLIIMFRPFKIGDFVEAGGTSGVVNEISIFSTIFKTPDNKTVIIANSTIMGGNIVNYSSEATRRVDLTVGVSYTADLNQVKQELQNIAEAESRLLSDKDVTIAVAELADCSVNLVFRVWVKSEDYWPTFFDLTEKVKTTFDEKGIEIPFPQLDVFVKNPS
ncbi:MAG: mechanosensitive ion channel [Agarilytica sp.]